MEWEFSMRLTWEKEQGELIGDCWMVVFLLFPKLKTVISIVGNLGSVGDNVKYMLTAPLNLICPL